MLLILASSAQKVTALLRSVIIHGQTPRVKNEIGQVRETDYIYIKGTDLKMRSINPPEGFWCSENKGEIIKNNIRSLLQNFGIKVYVFKDRIEVQGLIPTEIISLSSETKRSDRELIIPSVRGRG